MRSRRVKLYFLCLTSTLNLVSSLSVQSEETFFTPSEARDSGLAFDISLFRLSLLGDINGDGFDDYQYKETISSDTYKVVLGDASGFSQEEIQAGFSSTTSFAIKINLSGGLKSDTSSSNNFRRILGDINNDGIDDVLIDSTVLYGSSSFLSDLADIETIDQISVNGNNGFSITVPSSSTNTPSLVHLGDINGDSLSDLGIVWESKAFIFFGSTQGFPSEIDLAAVEFDGTNGFTIENLNEPSISIFSYGDFNNDYYDDIFVYNDSRNVSNDEAVIILLGGSETFDSTYQLNNIEAYSDDAIIIEGKYTPSGEQYLINLPTFENVGDIDGDGDHDYLSDMTSLYQTENVLPGIYNSQYLFDSGVIVEDILNKVLGNGALTEIDFNNDGNDDIISHNIAAHLGDNATAGSVVKIVFGNSNLPITTDEFDSIIVDDVFIQEGLKTTLEALGDINRDGFGDFAHGNTIYLGRESLPVKAPYQTITSYGTAFSGPNQTSGWNYYWSRGRMKWTGWNYNDDGISGPHRSSDLSYGNLNRGGGHPGKGSVGDSVPSDIYVIAEYQVGQNGEYAITNSLIEHPVSSCSQWSNGGELILETRGSSTRTRKILTYEKESSAIFDMELGVLEAGDRIRVLIGPNGQDGCDAFSLDYAIAVRGDITNTAPVITDIPDQVSNVGEAITPITFSISDAEGDSLEFFDNYGRGLQLPSGIRLSSTSTPGTYILEGSPTKAGNYSVDLRVDDKSGAYDITEFEWQIGNKGQTLTNYREDFGNTDNWSYLWNESTPIGTASGYTPLVWTGYDYRSGESTYPASSELKYGFLGPQRGHPGSGTSNGASTDRYVIAAYTFSEAGNFSITDSSLTTTCEWSNGLDAHVYLNDQVIPPASDFYDGINRNLGAVEAGDTVYVAIGPNGSHGCDAFLIDYSIEYNE